MSGSNSHSQKGIYGSKGVAAASNIPGARFEPQAWIDLSGTIWLFAGTGIDSTGSNGLLNDLWKYNAGEWTWVGGANTLNQSGIYGTKGSPAPDNVPGARNSGAAWADTAGNLWLFGGGGLDSTGTSGDLDDLWLYSGGEWTWMSGSNLVNEQANYGSQGIAAPGNTPGARGNCAVWTDTAGNFWLFGGTSVNAAVGQFWLSDLWKYSAGQWTWVTGPDTTNQPGVYGTQGVPAPGNIPGARMESGAWIDQSGDLWLLGGVPSSLGNLNDLWKYQP